MPDTFTNPEANLALRTAAEILGNGGVIAYPTEAVYGLGCDPFNEAAVQTLFHVKQRPMEKGVILVAASVAQIAAYVQLTGMPWEQKVLATWPGPVTWVLPLKQPLPEWITGGRDTVAIRVSAHPLVQALCEAFGKPIVSTSANLSTRPPAKSCDEVKAVFADQVFCLEGTLGELAQPTQIWDARSGERLR
ncbi:L-threonylcarbamoyladenylate synthase [Thiomicrorhabdus cannonii]|uniref:L-threonylcarbamoyladenylate synthase n=1 Tax=Thiomicrorhabdus cannonii TaxID=2748011 RepID=UPI0015BA88AF|nr:L-threonylcarbamoyladenylate synthase [Thiomicrorhabdus cannonii]